MVTDYGVYGGGRDLRGGRLCGSENKGSDFFRSGGDCPAFGIWRDVKAPSGKSHGSFRLERHDPHLRNGPDPGKCGLSDESERYAQGVENRGDFPGGNRRHYPSGFHPGNGGVRPGESSGGHSPHSRRSGGDYAHVGGGKRGGAAGSGLLRGGGDGLAGAHRTAGGVGLSAAGGEGLYRRRRP